MGVAEGVHEVADLEAGHLGDHVRQQGVRRDVERHAEEHVGRALVELAAQPAAGLGRGDVELEHRVARRQRHVGYVGDVPRRDDVPARVGVGADLLDDLRELVDVPAVGGRPRAPLVAVDRTEVAVGVGPLVPDGDAAVLQPLHVGVAAHEPQQLAEDRPGVHLLGGHQREALGRGRSASGGRRRCGCRCRCGRTSRLPRRGSAGGGRGTPAWGQGTRGRLVPMVIGLGAALLAAVLFGVGAVVQAVAVRRHGLVSRMMAAGRGDSTSLGWVLHRRRDRLRAAVRRPGRHRRLAGRHRAPRRDGGRRAARAPALVAIAAHGRRPGAAGAGRRRRRQHHDVETERTPSCSTPGSSCCSCSGSAGRALRTAPRRRRCSGSSPGSPTPAPRSPPARWSTRPRPRHRRRRPHAIGALRAARVLALLRSPCDRDLGDRRDRAVILLQTLVPPSSGSPSSPTRCGPAGGRSPSSASLVSTAGALVLMRRRGRLEHLERRPRLEQDADGWMDP